jgi:hypothetical protein
MTVGWILQPGFPDTTEAGDENVFADAGGITEWGNHTQVIASGIAVQDLRWQIVQEHVRVRKNPRQVIQFTPMFRAAVDDEVRINAKFRCTVPTWRLSPRVRSG